MEHKESQPEKLRLREQKQPYEAPKATPIPVKPEERVMQCNFSTYRSCGPNG